MEHTTMRWVVAWDEQQSWWVVTDEPDPWYICEVHPYLPGDRDGNLTAQAICDAHNASIANAQIGCGTPSAEPDGSAGGE